MERIPRAIYTKEVREEAVKLVMEGGLSIPEVGRRLSVSPSTIRYWVKANREGKLKEVGFGMNLDLDKNFLCVV